MNGWIKINEYRLFIRRIVAYSVESRELRIAYFDGVRTDTLQIEYHYEHHAKRLDTLFNIERNNDARISKTDTRITPAAY